MIVTITEVGQQFTRTGAEYKVVKGTTDKGQETTKSVFDILQDKWPLLVKGATLDFKMEKKGQFWNVVDINPIQDKGIEPPVKQNEPITAGVSIPQKVSGEEMGMWWKELGECLRAGYVKSDSLRKFYLAKMYSVIGFEAGQSKPKPPEEPEPEEDIPVEDIPFE